VVTELAVVDITSDGFRLRELREGVNLETVMRSAGARLSADAQIGRF
jgi:acyl CoA:acetate/3-ketoacid CoA transferase beta subunit